MWSALLFPTKNQPAIKFPTVPIISPSWKHLFESKCSSITPPWWIHMKTISSLSLQLHPDHKHSKSIFSHLLMHSCREIENPLEAVSRREFCTRQSTEVRSVGPDAPQSTQTDGSFHSYLPCSSRAAFPLFLLLKFISSARSKLASVLAVLTSSLNFLTCKIWPAWLISIYFPPTPILCRRIFKFLLELTVPSFQKVGSCQHFWVAKTQKWSKKMNTQHIP